jgi:hypothetical protein
LALGALFCSISHQRLPERDQGMFGISTWMVVVRVVYRLLRGLGQPSDVESAVREILPQLTTSSAKSRLITIVGYREGAGHKLVSEEVAREFEKSWRVEVRAATPDHLAQEAELLRILLLVKREAGGSEPTVDVPDSPHVTLALLRSARSEVRSQGMGSRAVRHSARLAWDALVEVYGSDDILRERIKELKDTRPEGVDELLALADKYLGGWRPSDSGED